MIIPSALGEQAVPVNARGQIVLCKRAQAPGRQMSRSRSPRRRGVLPDNDPMLFLCAAICDADVAAAPLIVPAAVAPFVLDAVAPALAPPPAAADLVVAPRIRLDRHYNKFQTLPRHRLVEAILYISRHTVCIMVLRARLGRCTRSDIANILCSCLQVSPYCALPSSDWNECLSVCKDVYVTRGVALNNIRFGIREGDSGSFGPLFAEFGPVRLDRTPLTRSISRIVIILHGGPNPVEMTHSFVPPLNHDFELVDGHNPNMAYLFRPPNIRVRW